MNLTSENAAAVFFERVDMNQKLRINSADDLWEWVLSEGSAAPEGKNSLPTDPMVAYRGQPRVDYGLTSSLYRLCRKAMPTGVTERRLASVEATVIKAMRAQGLGRRMSDGQLLSVLQHHGVPTRLIDFSRKPLEALYFVVEKEDTVDGRLFVVWAHGRSRSLDVDLRFAPDGDAKLAWRDHARGSQNAVDDWTQTVALVDPKDLDPRMVAQQGVFLVGGLNRKSHGRSMGWKAPGQRRCGGLDKSLFPDVTALGVNFVTKVGSPHQSWPATGWTIRVPWRWKPDLRKYLAAEADPINRDTMYPPVDEVWRLANYAVLEDLARGA